MNSKLLALFTIIILTCCSQTSAQIFVEKDGIVKIEMESIPVLQNWQVKSDGSGFTGVGYIAWVGSEYFNNTTNGRMEYQIKITNPGTYAFKWYSKVGNGSNTTEHNDTWLKISGAADFYGKKSGGNIVRPRGVCTNDCPAGSGGNGYFKIYTNNLSWNWFSTTSDNDPHEIFAVFDAPGIYSINIAARSSWHLIDKMVLFNVAMTNQNTATSNNTPFSEIADATSTDFLKENDILLFPNPTQSNLSVNLANTTFKVSKIEMINMAGQVVYSREINGQAESLHIQVGHFPKGEYIVRMSSEQDQLIKKIVLF